jgi:hypothetical protein
MSAGSEDDLICDFAETYHVLNWRELPLKLAATLAFGLPENSRSKMRINGMSVSTETLMIAKITDLLATWIWWNSEDGTKSINAPKSLVELLTKKKDPEQKIRTFRNGSEFMTAYQQIAGER